MGGGAVGVVDCLIAAVGWQWSRRLVGMRLICREAKAADHHDRDHDITPPPRTPFEAGVVINYEGQETLFDYAFDRLGVTGEARVGPLVS